MHNIAAIIETLRALKQLRAHDTWSRQQLDASREQALVTLRSFAMQHSPFYRQFYRNLQTAPFSALPVLTKRMMMEHFDEVVTDSRIRLADVQKHVAEGDNGRFLGTYEVVTTSGSTGQPGVFLFGSHEWTTLLASFARARAWAGLKVALTQRSKMAVVSSTVVRNLSARVGKAVNTPFLPTLRLDATEPLSDIVAQLNRWQPESLVAYASMAYLLAQEQHAGRLHIAPFAVMTSSEVLTPQMRRVIEETWGKVVFNEFAATETASIAAEDIHHHGMHVFEDLLIVENVNDANEPVPAGTFGEKLLITTLFSRTQPLIRYELSDSVRFAEQQPLCPLPYRIIDGVQGRQEDMLALPGTQGQMVRVHPNVFHAVMDLIPNRGWRIVQGKETLNVVVAHPEANLFALRSQLEKALQQQGVKVPEIDVLPVESIPRAKSGKSPLIEAYKGSALKEAEDSGLSPAF